MKRIHPDPQWPVSWKSSYEYDLQEIYGEIANRGYCYAYENRRSQTLRLLSEALPRGARILDIGAAQGNFSLALAEMGFEVTWNDLRAELADYVRLKHEQGVLHFAPGDAFALSFPQQFDAVLITEIIEHVAHPDEFLAKTAELLAPGGFIVMTTPNGAYFRNPLPRFSDCPDPSVYESIQFKPDADGHIFLLHAEEIAQLAAACGLCIDRLLLFTNSLTNGHIKLRYALGLLPRALVEHLERLSQRLPPVLSRRLMVQMAVRLQKPSASTALPAEVAA